MASESTEGQTVSVELPSELTDWLDEQAEELDIPRDQLVLQLLASYRKTAELEEEASGAHVIPEAAIAETVREQVDAAFDERATEWLEEEFDATEHVDEELQGRIEQTVQSILAERVQQQVEAAVKETADSLVTDRVNEATNGVQRQLGNRIDSVETEFQGKLEDVRERVIQVKKEADGKAPSEHSHTEFEAFDELTAQVEAMESELTALQNEFEETIPEHSETISDVDSRLVEMEERLQTVAWVVSDLREAQESGNGLQAVERIKRAAAKADISRAKCENCGEGVTLSLLTDPECPHCSATVTNVEPDPGWFRKPKLRVASKLESGESE